MPETNASKEEVFPAAAFPRRPDGGGRLAGERGVWLRGMEFSPGEKLTADRSETNRSGRGRRGIFTSGKMKEKGRPAWNP